ncbi:glycosyltransferase family 1 protein [Gordonia amicalis]|uniref:glycosyltransferase family 4 protein n=1 Tax=Gordonia amicalis TaxID=89053 RepID=UPI0022B5D670|nr:glycosyltransferase family 1 protein [Gordonia amicalis]MCZ4653821.1 glycosyltransferase family 1 protein [Gordonia amicalis]
MIIGVDGILAGSGRTGMGVMVYEVLRQLSESDNIEHNYLLFIPESQLCDDLEALQTNRVQIVRLPSIPYPVWEQFVLPVLAKRYAVDLFWFPYNTASLAFTRPSIVTVHDTIYLEGSWLEPPTIKKKVGKLYRRLVVPGAYRRADKIHTVSAYSRDQIKNTLGVHPNEFSVVPLGARLAETSLAPESDATELGDEFPSEFILGYASSEPRKNLRGILESYETAVQADPTLPPLVLFGHKDFASTEENQWLLSRPHLKITVLPYISNETKARLLQNCAIFVFPSLSEGFGLPVVEAFQAGAPVVTANTTAVAEVAGEAALTVDPSDNAAIAQSIVAVWQDKELAARLRDLGLRRAEQFTWTETGRKLEDVFSEAHLDRNTRRKSDKTRHRFIDRNTWSNVGSRR